MKTYQSGSVASLSIILPNGRSKYISFDSTSNGKSLFSTNDKNIMAGIESSRRFREGGIILVADDTPKETKKKDPIPVKNEEYKEVQVNSWDDAKDYLVDELGIPTKSIRTQSQISAAAEANHIKFIF